MRCNTSCRPPTDREVVQFIDRRDVKRDVEAALREGRMGYEESGQLLKFYEEGMNGYTYFRRRPRTLSSGSKHLYAFVLKWTYADYDRPAG